MVSVAQLEKRVERERKRAEQEVKMAKLQRELKELKNRNKITAGKVGRALVTAGRETGKALKPIGVGVRNYFTPSRRASFQRTDYRGLSKKERKILKRINKMQGYPSRRVFIPPQSYAPRQRTYNDIQSEIDEMARNPI